MNRIRRSPLIRRLRRHAGFGVLYPSDDAGAFADIHTRTDPPSNTVPVVQASLLKPGMKLPDGASFAFQNETRTPPGRISSRPDESRRESFRLAEMPSIPIPADESRQSAAPEIIDRAETETGGFTDAEWQRLSTIMRKHEKVDEVVVPESEPLDQEEMPISAQDPQQAAHVDPSPAPPDKEQIRHEEALPYHQARTEDRPVIQRSRTPQPDKIEGSEPDAEARIRRVDADPDRADPNAVQRESNLDVMYERSDLPPFLEQREHGITDAGEPPLSASPAHPEPETFGQPETVQNAPAAAEYSDAIPSEGEPLGKPQVPVPSEKPAAFGRTLQQQPADESEDESSRASSTPLEEVWPVQVSRTARHGSTRLMSSETERTFVDDESGHTIRRMVEDIPSGEKTGSAIEWVSPRSPRPKTTPRSIQRAQEEGNSPPDTHDSDVGPEPSAGPDVETHPNIEDAEPENTEIELVPTEVGSLPRDLWWLIGEQPPTLKDTPVQVREPSGMSTGERKTEPALPLTHVQRKADEDESKRQQQVERAGSVDAGDTIITHGAAASEVEAGSRQDEAQEEEDALDTDAIARQVYARLRTRLVVEWERLRQRF